MLLSADENVVRHNGKEAVDDLQGARGNSGTFFLAGDLLMDAPPTTFDPRIGVAAGVSGSPTDSALDLANAPPLEPSRLLPALFIAGALWFFFRK